MTRPILKGKKIRIFLGKNQNFFKKSEFLKPLADPVWKFPP